MTFRLAFAKGRGAAEGISLLEPGAIAIPRVFSEGKLTVHRLSRPDLLCVLVRGRDVARLLAQGHIDAAVGSCLLFEEYDGPEIFQAAALNIATCRFSLITPDDGLEKNLTCIGTRYPHLTKKLVKNICPSLSLIELGGCIESALFLGMCDAITDVVETGWTIKTLALREREVLSTFGHGVWVRYDERHSCISKLEPLMPSVDWNESTRASPHRPKQKTFSGRDPAYS